MSVNYTPSQRAAIDNRGGALLVAAAAGSGKTKVLVERLLSRVTDNSKPVDIDKFLIITYTKSAAAELRSKILDEINARIADNPENRQLRRQLTLIYKAPISTIHSFCSAILRENAHMLDISPDFRVMESDESELLMQKVLDDVLNSRYENPDEDFKLLTDTMATGRDDAKLSPLVTEFYTKLKSHPYPEKWAVERLSELEACSKATDVAETPWGRIIMEQAALSVDYWLAAFGSAVKTLSCDEALSAAYLDSFLETESGLKCLKEALKEGWDKARSALPVDFPRLKSLRGSTFEAEEAKRVREDCKDEMKKLCDTFDSTSAELLEDMLAVLPAVRALTALALDFDKAYYAEKARRKILDFSDMEHLALRLLVSENGEPSVKAKELSKRYAEIMVDEYQDANEIQDILINSVSDEGRNVFMVGDVKQSIYRFRLADPTIFLRKYEAFADAALAKESEPRRIILQDNFRSRQNVLDAVNFVFSNIMSKEFGEMDYSENERLNLGKTDFPESADKAFELNLIEIPKLDDEDAPDKTETEAAFVAQRIRELLDSGMLITEKDGQRKLCCGDVAILLRSVKGKAEVYANALRMQNIPVYTENGGGFWEKTEICVMASLLAIIDNPRQDVALISVLRSPVFGFTPDELAEIRAADKGNDYYSALIKASEKSEKCSEFIAFLGELRLSASDMAVDALIWNIYSLTSAMAIFGAMDGGTERKNNLMALFEMARQFESAGYKGLFDFVTQLNKLMKRGGEVAARSSQTAGNAVTISSIHKSKGLEYPVVIIADTGKQFNKDDVRRPLLLHSALGVGPKRLDLKRRIEYTTLPRMAIAKRMTNEAMAEELRVLYVAMTRAKEKLIVTCASKNTERLLEKLSRSAKAPIAPQILSGCASMGEWLLLAALLRKEAAGFKNVNTSLYEKSRDSVWDIRHIAPENTNNAIENESDMLEEAPPEEALPEAELKEIERNLAFRYAHEAATALPSKLTATGIKGRFLDKEAAEEAENLKEPQRKLVFDRPNFALEDTALTAAERGIALHLVMQYIDYQNCGSLAEISAEIKRLSELKIISSKQAAAVPPEKILRFFDSELGKSILEADSLLREFKFSLLVPASDYFTEGEGEEILLQGVVDCCYEKQGGLTVVDFKTDYVTKENQKERAESYRPQIDAYAKALERITGKPVKRKILYFFRTDEALEV
jgi:ATP-dependent helicase/nuclease subunit A